MLIKENVFVITAAEPDKPGAPRYCFSNGGNKTAAVRDWAFFYTQQEAEMWARRHKLVLDGCEVAIVSYWRSCEISEPSPSAGAPAGKARNVWRR